MPDVLPDDTHKLQPVGLFPERIGFCGPVTAQRICRLLLLYIALLSIGLYLSSNSAQTYWQIFGLGLMLPGGGFLAHADFTSGSGLLYIAIAASGLLAFGIAVFIWFATGNVLAPPLVWLLFALAAAGMKHGHVHHAAVWSILTIIGAAAVLAVMASVLIKILGKRKRRETNTWLRTCGDNVASTFVKSVSDKPEFSLDDLKRMRFLLDRALQPIEQFNGFE